MQVVRVTLKNLSQRINPLGIVTGCVCLLLFSISCFSATAEPNQTHPNAKESSPENNAYSPLVITTRHYTKTTQAHSIYFVKLIELALKNTEKTDGPFIIREHPEALTSKRFLAELMRDGGIINLLWATSDKKREQELRPIKIPLLKNTDHYRILLIRENDQNKFDSIKNLKDLGQLSAGIGSNWPDKAILQKNNLPYIDTIQTQLLFNMLLNKRFDYFPRGIYEAWNEKETPESVGLAIEQHLLLYYWSPIYFFVNKKDEALADRLERGLKIAAKNGDMDKLFFSIPSFKRGYDELKNNNRTRIDLITEPKAED